MTRTRRGRGGVPVLSTVLLVAIVAMAAASVGTMALSLSPAEPAAQASIDGAVDASTGEIVLIHEGGDPIDVRQLEVRITVEGEPLREQPPVPFFSAEGFEGGPSGPFNAATDPEWTTGERVALGIAGTNEPYPAPGDEVVVRLAVDGTPVATVEATA